MKLELVRLGKVSAETKGTMDINFLFDAWTGEYNCPSPDTYTCP